VPYGTGLLLDALSAEDVLPECCLGIETPGYERIYKGLLQTPGEGVEEDSERRISLVIQEFRKGPGVEMSSVKSVVESHGFKPIQIRALSSFILKECRAPLEVSEKSLMPSPNLNPNLNPNPNSNPT